MSSVPFEKYVSLAKYFARISTGKNFIFSEEDIYQELMTKLISSWDYISQEESESGRLALVKKIFRNHVIYLIQYCSNRPDTSVNSKESMIESDENEGWVFDSSSNSISDGSRFPNPESAASYKELVNILKKAAEEAKDVNIKIYLSSILDPEKAEELEKKNDKYEEKAIRKVNKSYIPPFVRAKLLGRASSFPYRVMAFCENALKSTGYKVEENI